MALMFPNASRAYISGKRCVRFWGHDSTAEIAFEVADDSLRVICPEVERTEAAILAAFDDHRLRIEQVAAKKYARDKQSYIHLDSENF